MNDFTSSLENDVKQRLFGARHHVDDKVALLANFGAQQRVPLTHCVTSGRWLVDGLAVPASTSA